MSTSEASRNHYLTGQHKEATQHHAWRNAENSAAHLFPHLRTLTQPIKLLDAACGSGTITASLATYLPANSSITALDQSDEILVKASSFASEKGIRNISFQKGDVFNLPFEDGEFDVVHVSMLLAHLSEPQKAIKELLRVTKKNSGVLSLREPDMKVWSYYPSHPAIAKTQETLCKVFAGNGSCAEAAQRLLSWTMGCGAGIKREQIKCSASAWCFSTKEEREVWGGTMVDRCARGDMKDMALREGWATEEEFEDMVSAWKEWIECEEGWFATLNGEVLVFP